MRIRMFPTQRRKCRVSRRVCWIRGWVQMPLRRNQGKIVVRAAGAGVVAADEGDVPTAGVNQEGMRGIRRPSRDLPEREVSPMAQTWPRVSAGLRRSVVRFRRVGRFCL